MQFSTLELVVFLRDKRKYNEGMQFLAHKFLRNNPMSYIFSLEHRPRVVQKYTS
jgi:hypothetical protein